jgi:hypothetical protein
MTDQAEERAPVLARLWQATAAMTDHARECGLCAHFLAHEPDNPPECETGAHLYGRWLTVMLSAVTRARAPE